MERRFATDLTLVGDEINHALDAFMEVQIKMGRDGREDKASALEASIEEILTPAFVVSSRPPRKRNTISATVGGRETELALAEGLDLITPKVEETLANNRPLKVGMRRWRAAKNAARCVSRMRQQLDDPSLLSTAH